MTILLAIVFFVMAACALASAFTGAAMVLGVAERSWPNRFLQRMLLAQAVMWCAIGCILILVIG